MEMGKYWILLMLMLTTGGKRAIKRPTTLAHFSFLVPEREILVKIKASVETVQYSILVNFDDQKWSVMSEEMNMIFKHFEELPFSNKMQNFESQQCLYWGRVFKTKRKLNRT
jgi:hypothetical protein